MRQTIIDTLNRSKAGLQLSEVVRRTGLERGAAAYHLHVLRRQKKVRMIGTRATAVWLP